MSLDVKVNDQSMKNKLKDYWESKTTLQWFCIFGWLIISLAILTGAMDFWTYLFSETKTEVWTWSKPAFLSLLLIQIIQAWYGIFFKFLEDMLRWEKPKMEKKKEEQKS